MFFKLNKTLLALAITNIVLYTCFAYNLVRTEYIKLVGLYTVLFILFYIIIRVFKHNIKTLTYLAFIFRAIFIFATPNLSQDFYRFIWDGRIILEGINPYLYTVTSFINHGEFPVNQAQELYNGMGLLNASHFSNYPPVNQLCFVIANLFSSKNILGAAIVMRILIISADFGTLYFGKKLLTQLNLPIYSIFWYILNPFIIIELTGNLHFEGVMIFFLIWSLYLLHLNKWQWAAVIFALSVSVKLIPLIFLPLFFNWFLIKTPIHKNKLKKWIPKRKDTIKLALFYLIIIGITLLLFTPFFASGFINNYSETVALWFTNFQFNASLFSIAKAIGYSFRGRNEIVIIGKITTLIVFLFVLIIAFYKKQKNTTQLITSMLLVLSFYFFTATTVHPWYVATLLMLSVFTKYKFPLIWSFVIILSYLAYININKADKSENLLIIAIEYTVVYSVFIWEVFIKKASCLEA